MLEHKAEHQCSSNSYGLAASRGHLEVCKWLHETMPDLRCPVWAAETAAAAGYLEVSALLFDLLDVNVTLAARSPSSHSFCITTIYDSLLILQATYVGGAGS